MVNVDVTFNVKKKGFSIQSGILLWVRNFCVV